MWCLGDLVGYGAEPDACVELARRHAAVCLAGNHDLGVRGTLPLEQFSRGAALAARWTQETITAETREFLDSLEPSNIDEEVGLYHASPRDPVWEYVLSPLQAELCLDEQPHRVCLSAIRTWRCRSAGSPARSATGETRANDEYSTSPGASGCSTRAASASPGTATLEPPGWSSTSTAGTPGLSPHGLRHRGRRRRDPGRPAAGFAGRAACLRPVRPGLRGPNLPQTVAFSKVRARMGYAPRALLAGGLGLAASFLVACGGGGPRPALKRPSQQPPGPARPAFVRARRGPLWRGRKRRRRAEQHRQQPAVDVNPALAANLQQGASTVASLAQSQCSQSATDDVDQLDADDDLELDDARRRRRRPRAPPPTTTTSTSHTDEHCNLDDQLG